jgi:hypothetical protein
MDENRNQNAVPEIRGMMRDVIQEFLQTQSGRTEPAYKAELEDERSRREQLERRLNELVEENRKTRQQTEQLERESMVRGELQRLGVTKVDLAWRAVKDDIVRDGGGRLVGRTENGALEARDYLKNFVEANPELLPARISGGAGSQSGSRGNGSGSFDLEKIRPDMSEEDRERARQEIARIAQQSIRL